MGLIEIKERSNFDGVGRIDKEAQQLKDITILNVDTGNQYIAGTVGTKFSEEARRDLVNLAENCKVFIDHQSISADRDNRGVRSIKDLAGYIESTYLNNDGKVKGHFKYLKKFAPMIEELAEVMPSEVGFSIHAFGPMHKEGQYGVVEGFKRLPSVDFVSEAAHQGGLFESQRNENNKEDNSMDKTDMYGLTAGDKAVLEASELEGKEWDDYRNRLIKINEVKEQKKASGDNRDEYLSAINSDDSW